MLNIRWWKVGSFVAAFTAVVGIAWASGDWSSAKDSVEKLKNRQGDLRKLSIDEQAKIVTAICAADRDERESAGKDAADRVSRTVTNEIGELRNMRDYSYRLLDEVIADDNLKDQRDEAKQLREDVAKRWDSITNMVEMAMRGANHPVVAYLIRAGQDAHKQYQRDNCDAYEFSTGSRIADCIKATGETCTVIELKPNNSNAISKGNTQLRDQLHDLNEAVKNPDSSLIKDLINKKSDFAKCKRFEGRIDCYTLCPVLNEKGEYREANPDWKKDCS